MNKLETRLFKLETMMGARTKPLVIRCISWADGDAIGFSTPAGDVMRKPGETEESLFKRACKGLTGLVTVREIREGDGRPYVHPYELLEPTREPETKPEPKIDNVVVPIPSAVAPRKPEPAEVKVVTGRNYGASDSSPELMRLFRST